MESEYLLMDFQNSVDPLGVAFLPFLLSFAFQWEGGQISQEEIRAKPKNFWISQHYSAKSNAVQKLKDIFGWLVQGY